MSPLRGARGSWRALGIARVLLRHRLDALLEGTAVGRWLWLLKPVTRRKGAADLPRGQRLRLALQELGPIFVKFGQVLSTRRDLLPPDVAEELSLLQDRVAPFPGEQARARIELGLGRPVAELFAEFEPTPLASASIAQVHAARLHDGREVVVKVLRPGIRQRIAEDIDLLRTLAALADRHHPSADKIRPQEVVSEIESTLYAELDLQREGANASLMRRTWEGSDELYVPEVFWTHTSESVLTMERVRGIPSDDVAALDAAGIDRKALAARGVRVFYTQVFRDNFFHADAHAGNIWVDLDPARKANPRFIAIDFGIVGQLTRQDQYYLAENFMAIFQRDYRRIAELHIEAGWMPDTVRIDELEAATRAVCEPYFTRPLSEISLGEVLVKLFKTAQRYELTLQPQLILLQKTLLNIEGVGRLLDPKLDIWAEARPVLEKILRERYSPATLGAEFRKRLPELVTHAPDMPRLLHEFLVQQVRGRHSIHMRSEDLAELARISRAGQRQTVYAILGTGLMIVAAVLYALEAGGPQFWGIPAAAAIAGLGAFGAFLAAWPRR
ncbi:ubiquinone biosynthesis regulatory protein kinase UbiB [Arenimonas caeni]|jgi:ubiquinone biosynthesis protein|uniref:Ubiquinone biosynthesis regulatory protein kinase UbiB n=1 Tax=Arenimonas caeni TaxID=2058085 RepID=A0A2P6M955_9GAMM|nr:ubiquinone biosynthesis regulatory protein kinase UbiB [Arenimonas caeni]MDY0021919.1 ubiquinone biosynthesis regulatory protein kinase UbiB [Arenimonas caeni]PRH82521.1 ubiquinone biosynthesis regulatory protein kinase UbiB [Arenimonas caeni]